jgi:transposase
LKERKKLSILIQVYEAGKLLRNLTLKADQWWYFLDHPEIPPDNNLAERALRLAVTKRKAAFG